MITVPKITVLDAVKKLPCVACVKINLKRKTKQCINAFDEI